MKVQYIFLCIMFMFLCMPVLKAEADELDWAKKAREVGPSPTTKAAYDRAVAKQAAKKKAEGEKWAQEEKVRKESEAEQAVIDAQNEAVEEALQKECGVDYKQVKVGMKLSRVQKCVGEFSLSGQTKWAGGTVDYYTWGSAYLYVKNGRVVAWGN